MGLSPMALKVFTTSISLRIYLFIILGGLMCVCQELSRWACLSPVLVCRPSDFLPWPLDVAVVPQTHIGLFRSKCNHGKRCHTAWATYHAWLNRLRLGVESKMCWTVAVDNVTVMT